MRKLWLVAVAAMALVGTVWGASSPAAGAQAPAARAKGGIDRAFGRNGIARPTGQIPGYAESWAFAMSVAPDGRIYLLERAGSCAGACAYDTFLIRLTPDGRLDRTFAGGAGSVLLPTAGNAHDTKLAVDRQGRAWILALEGETVKIVRVLPSGGLDPSFGAAGQVSLPCGVCEGAELTLRPERGGGALIWGSRLDPLAPPYPSSLVFPRRILLLRVAENGDPEAGFGSGGLSDLVVEHAAEPGTSFVGRDGAITVAGGRPCCESPEGIYVERFHANGSPDLAFIQRAAQALAPLGQPMEGHINSVTAIVAAPGGALTLFGSSDSRGYALRILKDGAPDLKFGQDGVKWLRWPLRSVLPAGKGRLWAVTSSLGARGALVLMLSRDGRVVRAFGRRKLTVGLRRWEPLQVTVERQGSAGILFTPGYQGCRGFCAPKPMLARVKPVPHRRARRLHR